VRERESVCERVRVRQKRVCVRAFRDVVRINRDDVCACVRMRESVCMCARISGCYGHKQRGMCASVWERQSERVCTCAHTSGCCEHRERQRESVCEKERDREFVRKREREWVYAHAFRYVMST